MMERTTALLVVALIFLAGCTTTSARSFSHAYTATPLQGQDAAQLEVDRAACEQEIVPRIEKQRLTALWCTPCAAVEDFEINRHYRTCMEGRGYTLEQKPIRPGGS